MKHENISLADAYTTPDARFHAATLRTLNQLEPRENHRSTRVPLRTALIAAALLLALTAIAFATGTFQSVFAHMNGVWAGGPTTDYEHLDEVSGHDLYAQTFDCPNGARFTVELSQAYYNGEQLALGWSLRPEGEFAWLYERDDPQYADLHPETEEFDNYISYHGFADRTLYDVIGVDAGEEFDRRLKEDGWAGVAWYECYLGDGIYLPGVPGTSYSFDGTVSGTTEDMALEFDSDLHWRQDATDYLYQECGSLPDAARNLDALPVKIHARSTLRWYCEDASGRYYGYADAPAETTEVLVEVSRSEDYEELSYQTDAAFPNHTASIQLHTTPIYAQFDIENTIPAEWIAIWNDPKNFPDDKYPLRFPEDVFYEYEFYAEVGGELQRLPKHYRSQEEPLCWSGNFILPDGATSLHIRPVYYNSGEHPEEDIIIPLE